MSPAVFPYRPIIYLVTEIANKYRDYVSLVFMVKVLAKTTQKTIQCQGNPYFGVHGKVKIKALKPLAWHLSREPMKEISSLKKINKQ